MAKAHKGMKLPEHAFHALAGHLVTQLKVQGLGGPDERDFFLGVLKSVWQDEIKPSTHDVVNSALQAFDFGSNGFADRARTM